MYVHTLGSIKHAVHVPGHVISNQRIAGADGSELYHTVFRFRTLDGREIKATGKEATSSPSDFKPDEPIEVLYDSADPTQAQIQAFSQLWLGPVTVGGSGIACLLIAAALFLLGLRSRLD